MSKIEWTDQTWNPIIGCTKISHGCNNCYAETMAKRLSGIKTTAYYKNVIFQHPLAVNYGKWNGQTHFAESQLKKPLKWKKPRMIFVSSMGDLFHESVSFMDIRKVYDVIRKCPQHTFQILTKRPERMKDFYLEYYGFQNESNIWLGVTAENQELANKRIPILLQIPAKVHFVSVEPMLSAVDLSLWFYSIFLQLPYNDIIDWVICGGESGSNARPINPDWVRNLRDQCQELSVPFFFKQWGNKKSGCLLDGKEYKELLNIK